jgi:nucleoid DNA-binding protein
MFKTIINAAARRAGMPATQLTRAVQSFFVESAEALIKKGTVKIRGWGRFTLVRTPARTVVHPRTGSQIQTVPGVLVAFRASEGLREGARHVAAVQGAPDDSPGQGAEHSQSVPAGS